ncbi:hypothetical protein FB451DRAFT_1165399 [Mycena latifolia]|nr:hypothetical protein FB451DRAFT_1165399 [Mycena latifolia]
MSAPIAWSRVNICLPDGQTRKSRRRLGSRILNPAYLTLTTIVLKKTMPEISLDLWLFGFRVPAIPSWSIVPRVDYIYQAIQHLSPHFPKIKELELNVETSLFTLNSMIGMLLEPAPALEHLTLSTVYPHLGTVEDLTLKHFWKFLNKTSRLQSLTLSKALLGPMPKATGRRPHLAIRELTLNDIHGFRLDEVLETIEPSSA